MARASALLLVAAALPHLVAACGGSVEQAERRPVGTGGSAGAAPAGGSSGVGGGSAGTGGALGTSGAGGSVGRGGSPGTGGSAGAGGAGPVTCGSQSCSGLDAPVAAARLPACCPEPTLGV